VLRIEVMHEQVERLRHRNVLATAGRLGNLLGRLEAGPWREWNVIAVTRTTDPLRTGTRQPLVRLPAGRLQISHTPINSTLESFLLYTYLYTVHLP
jgi:hypothetical protein